MKKFYLSLFIVATLGLSLSCSKGGDGEDEETCEDTRETTVTFRNNTSAALRVVVSKTLTPQMVPVDPAFSIDLATGQSQVKTFEGGRWIASWYTGCPSACNRTASLFRDYLQCETYTEAQ